jgi:hypothetical protein
VVTFISLPIVAVVLLMFFWECSYKVLKQALFPLGMTLCFMEYRNAFSILKRLSDELCELKLRKRFILGQLPTWTEIYRRKMSELGK